MAIGQGIYDDLCTLIRVRTDAKGAIVIVTEGALGSGFSCQADLETTLALPEILERVAAQIRADRAKMESDILGKGQPK